MWIIWILLIVLVIWGVKAAVGGGNSGGNSGGGSGPPSALEILKQRYARGEIDQDEYERKRQDLIQ